MSFEKHARLYVGHEESSSDDYLSALDHADIESQSEFAETFYTCGIHDSKERIKELELELNEIADLYLTTGYTEKEGNRVFCGNEYPWLDAVAERLKKYRTKRFAR